MPATYGVLAKCERHVFAITADLDVDGTILSEYLSDSHLKGVFVLGLKKTMKYQYEPS